MESSSFQNSVLIDGYAILGQVMGPEEVSNLIVHAAELSFGAGTRNLLELKWAQTLAHSPTIVAIVAEILGSSFQPVRAILFDKRPNSNWNLGWHQDTKIAIKEKSLDAETHGYSSWSVKEGIPHVKPPRAVLENMIAVRIHLDECSITNGPLRVIPGTHLRGFISRVSEVQKSREVVCSCRPGDVILMRPLLLHASSKSESPAHRRVIHIEYSAAQLGGGLEWYYTQTAP